MSDVDQPESGVAGLQFQTAEPATKLCTACNQPVGATFFQAQGADVCGDCAERIKTGQQAPPAHSLLKAVIYGSGAAFAGFLLYTCVSIFLELEIGIISIAVGIMVGKAIRYASNGLGGRPQQILAVTLTYFAITFSYVASVIYYLANHDRLIVKIPLGAAAGHLAKLAVAGPFLQITSSGFSGLISLAIIFFGLSKAWSLTGRTELSITGPFDTEPASAS